MNRRYVNDKIQSRTAAALFNLSFTTGKKSINIYISRIPMNRRYVDDKIKSRTAAALATQ